jgi:hypothetical protein
MGTWQHVIMSYDTHWYCISYLGGRLDCRCRKSSMAFSCDGFVSGSGASCPTVRRSAVPVIISRRFARNDTMPDTFFATKSRKRKRVESKGTGSLSSKKVLKTSNGRRVSANGKGKSRSADEDLHSDGSESVALEDMDLRADEVDPNESGDEDAGETPAEKRLRLAKLYLQSVRDDLGASFPLLFLQPLMFTLYIIWTISGWGGRRGRNRQGVDFCSTQTGCA